MPSGVGVVETFKNLIRHGKNHQNAQREAKAQDTASHDQQNHSEQQHKQIQENIPAQQKSPDATREAAEMIVNEERENKIKLPVYKGLENFKLVDKMGDGAFSNVYKALDLTTGKNVAVKVVRKYELNASQAGDKHLNPQFKKKPRVTERANILKEVQIMRGTNHPSVVKLISFSESIEYYFLVLELMEGGELFHQIVKLTYFSEDLSRHVILQVANGIRYLHEERGVVHRDIKPENLLFAPIPIIPNPNPIHRQYDEDKADEGIFIPGVGGGGIGRVKIADFGLSKVVWNEETMTPCGTVGYTAPEIVKDERYSKSVDMWALGCVLYTLLCGFPPFYDESINVLTEKVARGYYTFLSPWWDDISPEAKDLITHLLCVDPTERYTIDEFLAHPWCNAKPAPAPPPTPFGYPDSVPPLSLPQSSRPLDSPLFRGEHGRARASPGVATLKEAFDVTYAVHRMEEEGARRRALGYGGKNGFKGGLNEEDDIEEEDEDEDEDDEPPPQPQATQAVGQRTVAQKVVGPGVPGEFSGRAGQRDRGERHGRRAGATGPSNRSRGFELDMDGATLLGRRGKKVGASPLAAHSLAPGAGYADPGSPMRM